MLSIQPREPLETLRKRLADDGSLDRIREQMRREKTGSVLFEKLAANRLAHPTFTVSNDAKVGCPFSDHSAHPQRVAVF